MSNLITPLSRTPFPNRCPVLPLRDLVAFPHMVLPLHIGRKKSVSVLDIEDVMRGRQPIVLATQKSAADDDPAPKAIHRMGVLAVILQALKLEDGSIKALFECTARARIARYTDTTEYLEAELEPVVELPGVAGTIETNAELAAAQFADYVKANKQISPEAPAVVRQVKDPSQLADIIGSHLAIGIADKQEILETTSVPDRLERVRSVMSIYPSIVPTREV